MTDVVIKCIPIVCLCVFVADAMRTSARTRTSINDVRKEPQELLSRSRPNSKGTSSTRARSSKTGRAVNNNNTPNIPIKTSSEIITNLNDGSTTSATSYHLAIIYGLVLSGIGDGLLVFTDDPAYFIAGLLSFALAHVAYIFAFSWGGGIRSIRAPLLLPCLLVSCMAFSAIYPGVAAHNLALLTALYNCLITAMIWRSLVQLESDQSWSNLAAFIGALLFFVSDFVLAMNKFSRPVPSAQTVVMTTYYAGQLGIALSVTNR